MLDHLRRLVKHSVAYGMAETISRGTGFILVFFYGFALSSEDIGLRGAVYSAATFVSIAYTLGLDNSFLRYFMDNDLSGRKSDIFTTATVFSSVIGIIILGVVFVGDSFVSTLLTKSPAYSYIIRLMFAILIFDNIVIYPTLVLRAENRLGYYSFISLVRFVLFLILNVVFVWNLKRGLNGVFEANFIVVIIVTLVMLPVYFEYLKGRVASDMLRKMLAFGIPTIFSILCMRVVDYSDKILILYLLGDKGAAELGGYNMAYTPGMVGIMVFVNSFRLAWQPFFLSLKDNPDNRNIFSRVATWYAAFMGYALVGITLFRREIFAIYAPKFPNELSAIIPFVSLAYILFGFYIIMTAGIFIKEKTRYLPFGAFIAAVLNLGLNFYFIPAFGIIGAAYTTIISYAAMVIVMYVISDRVYNVTYDFKRLGIACLLTVVPIALSLVIQPSNVIVSFVFRVVLVIVVPIMYLSDMYLLPDEREQLLNVVKKRFGMR